MEKSIWGDFGSDVAKAKAALETEYEFSYTPTSFRQAGLTAVDAGLVGAKTVTGLSDIAENRRIRRREAVKANASDIINGAMMLRSVLRGLF